MHNGGSCTGNNTDLFADAMTHYNPDSCPHPYHAGDMPPVFGADGYGFSVFLTDRFSPEEIIGKTVIIHSSPDDFITQLSGNSGTKIACGMILPVY
ncbi:MAG: superoxide dismutase family protein [Clostridia bacterium]|nr:superoxide dismutase family protein [Clostridia bacterium]